MEPIKKFSELEPVKKAYSLFDEFQRFTFGSKVVELAIGVVIGAAFGQLVSSLVKNIVMPVLGLIFPGQHGYSSWQITVEDKVIPYGQFLGELVNFLIVAVALFLFMKKFLTWMMRNRSDVPLTKDQELLTEIRDLLKKEEPGAETPPV